jgi:hypothetical protein
MQYKTQRELKREACLTPRQGLIAFMDAFGYDAVAARRDLIKAIEADEIRFEYHGINSYEGDDLRFIERRDRRAFLECARKTSPHSLDEIIKPPEDRRPGPDWDDFVVDVFDVPSLSRDSVRSSISASVDHQQESSNSVSQDRCLSARVDHQPKPTSNTTPQGGCLSASVNDQSELTSNASKKRKIKRPGQIEAPFVKVFNEEYPDGVPPGKMAKDVYPTLKKKIEKIRGYSWDKETSFARTAGRILDKHPELRVPWREPNSDS